MSTDDTELIPSGKHKGKRLSALSNASLLAMQGAWVELKRADPFLDKIQVEISKRKLPLLDKREPTEEKLKRKVFFAALDWLVADYGSRCQEYDATCIICRKWKQLDDLLAD
jgi:hypothetical protein